MTLCAIIIYRENTQKKLSLFDAECCLLLQTRMLGSEANKSVERNEVVLVTEDNVEVGVMDKLEAHRTGVLHRAFSIFIVNDQKELLLQQRALNKYHGGGLWTNSCCSHPRSGESLIAAGQERLEFEMGIVDFPLAYAFHFLYKGVVENGLIEHELDHVLLGSGNPAVLPNPEEVMDYKWIPLAQLEIEVEKQPERYTIWFRKCLPMVVEYLRNLA